MSATPHPITVTLHLTPVNHRWPVTPAAIDRALAVIDDRLVITEGFVYRVSVAGFSTDVPAEQVPA